eukprot:CAMPEP_0194582406 /NCGR_PEP_ID=MMETSP0292-20121207/15583_1 /TAXON_ID=39354 /ORGANISM="Heterosigma akashiwo, Strain CCMP2393" /LENGTH=92 /DNA_ID=CAMNT_0039436547 /DNA_START=289 /DNA_END=564 /DNA_ORIENTATION=+
MPRSKAEVKGCISSIVPRARVGPAAQQQPGHPPQAVLRRHHQRRGPLPVARVDGDAAACRQRRLHGGRAIVPDGTEKTLHLLVQVRGRGAFP